MLAARTFQRTAFQSLVQRRSYGVYRSRYGPKYTVASHFGGWTVADATNLGFTAAGFGVAAGTFALMFFCNVPRVRTDIMEKIPFISGFFHYEIAPEDNPF